MTPEFKTFTKNYFKLSGICTLIGMAGTAAWYIYLNHKVKKELGEAMEPLEDGDPDFELGFEEE